VGSERVRTYDKETDVALDESRKEIAEVGDHMLPA
jgi:hypothetical protein